MSNQQLVDDSSHMTFGNSLCRIKISFDYKDVDLNHLGAGESGPIAKRSFRHGRVIIEGSLKYLIGGDGWYNVAINNQNIARAITQNGEVCENAKLIERRSRSQNTWINY